MISDRVKGMENPIRDVVVKAKQLEKQGKKIYYMNIGDPAFFDFHPPSFVVEAAYEALKKQGRACYSSSEGIEELRQEIGKEESVSPEDVIITNGVSEGINYAIACLIDPGENILMPSPTYAPYMTMNRFMGGTDNFYHCAENWIPDVDDARKKINDKTRGILLVNPNNPTGTVYPQKVVKALVDLAGEHGVPVISDEIYVGMEYEGETPLAWKLSKDVPVISLNGYSKRYCCTGFRMGYAAFHNNCEELKNGMLGLCRMRLSANHPFQWAVLEVYRQKKQAQAYREELVGKLRKRRDYSYKRLSEMEGISCVKPAAAFYAFPSIGREWKSDKDFVYKLLDETGVLTVFGSGFSSRLEHTHFRLVFLATLEELEQAFDKMDAFVKKHSGKK